MPELPKEVKEVTCKLLDHPRMHINTEIHFITGKTTRKLQIRIYVCTICDITWRETQEIPF